MDAPDGLMIYAASESDSNLLWATRFSVPDPILYVESRPANGSRARRVLVASDLEHDRAKSEARVDEILPLSQFQKRARAREGATLDAASGPYDRAARVTAATHAAVLDHLGLRRLQVPFDYPTGLADLLRARGLVIAPKPDPFFEARLVKTADEVEAIEEALRGTEAALERAIETIAASDVGGDGTLFLEGEPLTSERLRRQLHEDLVRRDLVGHRTIVACGDHAREPHNVGSGPLRASETIVLDVFPRSSRTGYFADITRTVVRGRAPEEVRRLYEAVLEGQEIGIRAVRAGIPAADVHRSIQERFSELGYQTGPKDGLLQGFLHGTGHGLGLDIHEAPRVGISPDRLEAGHVITIEPGLYYRGLGGVRLEDVVVVEERGCRNLTRSPKRLEV